MSFWIYSLAMDDKSPLRGSPPRSDLGARLVAPDEGEVLRRPGVGGSATIKLDGDATGGHVAVWIGQRDAGDTGGPPAHKHDFDEIFFVLEGEYVFSTEGQELTAPVGTLVYVPGGSVHAFRSSGRVQGRMLCIGVPAGAEKVFRAAAEENRSEVARFE